jgi:hypothetical protein
MVSTLTVILFLEGVGMVEQLIISGFVGYMFVYALYLIEELEQPFRKGKGSMDDVSLFLLREAAQKIDAR